MREEKKREVACDKEKGKTEVGKYRDRENFPSALRE